MNFAINARFTCTVPSNFGSARMSRAAMAKYVSFSNPLAAMTSANGRFQPSLEAGARHERTL